ncbi:MAG: S41 family peptidase [Candidatus Falkowbacteria bacterium]
MKINREKINKLVPGLILLAILLATFWGGFYAGRKGTSVAGRSSARIIALTDAKTTVANSDDNFDFNLYWEVWDALKVNYVDKVKIKDKDLFYGSLKGLAESVGDPYTVFMDPTDAKEFANDLAGTFEGIGAEVGMRNEIVTIIAPLEGMPAQKAGLRAGDKVYAINGTSTIGLSVDQAVKLIRGKKGTKVTLTVLRSAGEKPKDIIITRDVIFVKSVKTEMRTDGIFVIKVTNFNDDTLSLFNAAVSEAVAKNPKGIILDLRNNPGGYLDTAVAMASEWVEAGPVVAEQFGDNKRNEYPSNGRARLKSFPTVVLVNGGSASASEILAGALRDYKKATLVGEQTYGKGSVQTLKDLSDGSTLKVTIAKWLTPAGDFINEKGIAPGVEIKYTQADIDKNVDPQMNKALDILKPRKK